MRTVILSILLTSAAIMPQQQAHAGIEDVSILDNAAWDLVKWVFGFANKDAVTVAQAGSITIDTASARQVGFYDDIQTYDHVTTQNGYQSAPVSTLDGQATTNHLIHEKQFAYYDLVVYDYDPTTQTLSNGQYWVEESFYIPTVYLNDQQYNVAIGTTKKWDVTYRAFSNYSNPNGDQDLRYPGNYTMTAHYVLSDLNATTSGVTSTPRGIVQTKPISMNAIAADNKNVDLLENKTQMSGKWLTGSHVRDWSLSPYLTGPPTPNAPQQVSVEWYIRVTEQP